MSARPNFILFITDQHRADHLGCYGNKIVRTPHIDSLSKAGSIFERFYVASPVCMANRATLVTGRMPSLHGVRHNGIPLSTEATTFVELLASQGYRTALVGKSHLQNMGYDAPHRKRWSNQNGGSEPDVSLLDASKAARRGHAYDNEWTPFWDADEKFGVRTPFYGFEDVALCTFHGDHVGGEYSRWLEQRHPGSDSLRGRENAIPDPRYSAPQAWRTRIPEELYPSTFIAERTCDWLEAHHSRSHGQPFFLQCSFPDPHHPYTPPGKYWDMYNPDDIALSPSFDCRDTTPLVRAVEADTIAGNTNREGYTPFTVNEREAREIVALTYGSISMIDDCVGRILAKLNSLNLSDDTVIMFTSDHGDWMGDHGMMLKGPLHYQGLIRVPFIFADTADKRTSVSRQDLCGTIDIAATVLDRAGIALYNGIQGRSLLRGPIPGDPERAMVIESEQVMYKFGRSKPFRVRSLVEGGFRLSISDEVDIGELYDLKEDPHETTNLWASNKHSAIRSRLIERLLREMVGLTDESPLPTALA